LLLAAWQITLWRSTGQDEIVVASSFDGRTCVEFETALGLFARYLPVPVRIAAGSTLAGLVAPLAQAVADAARWQDFFAPKLLESRLARPDCGPSWPFGFDFVPLATPDGSSWVLRRIEYGIDRCDLRLSVLERAGTFDLVLHGDLEGSDRVTAERLLERYGCVLAGVLAAPERPIAELAVLGAAERQELLVDFNRTARALPLDLCAHRLFEQQAQLNPDAPALFWRDRRSTYGELDAGANRLARRLRTLGAGPGTLVGLCLERSPEMVEGLLATLKAGAAYVPLDPGYPPARLAFMVADAGLSLLLTREGLLSRFSSDSGDSATSLPSALRVLCLEAENEVETLDSGIEADRLPSAGPDDLAYVIYTSGSTGRPKGVMVTHRGLVNYLAWGRDAYDAGSGRGTPVQSALGFDLTVTSLLLPLAAGSAVHLLVEEEGISALASALAAGPGFSLVKLTPSHLQVLDQLLPEERLAASTRSLVIGGEALMAESLSLWRRAAPRTRLINEYGPTETVVGCCVYEVTAEDDGSGPVAIGRPIANTRLYVLNTAMNPVVAGVPGELWIGGEGVARGYLGRPELTAERFLPDPFSAHAGGRLYG
ncbi:MAG TPA: amino acid adenylation domain-containing protein, partial [Thermoanaerobaculia bacterium]|nr:amino acid adenylation domain-containing protein [Thermoanaerobaculia bacterium]